MAQPGGDMPVDLLDELLLQVADAVVTVGRDGRIGYASPAIRQLLGFDPHTLMGQPARDYLDPDQIDEVMAAVNRPSHLRDNGRLVRLRHADGEYRDVRAFSRPSPTRVGRPVPVVLRPADDQRHTLDALRDRLAFEDLLTRVAAVFVHRPAHEVEEGIADALVEIGRFANVDRAYVYVLHDRRGLLELTHEWVAEQVAGTRSVRPLLPVDELPCWVEVLQAGEPVYLPRVSDLDGRWAADRRHLEAVGVQAALAVPLVDEHRLTGFVGFDLVGRDRLWSDDHVAVLTATAGIISQALARQEAEQRFGLAFDRAPLGMALHAPDGRHLQVNPAFCALLGRDEADILDTPVLAYVEPEDRDELIRAHREVVDGRVDQLAFELRFARADGEVVWCRVHTAAVRGADGALRYTVSHLEDVTERKRRESDLRSSEERYRTLVQNSPTIVLRYDRDLRLVFMSDGIEAVTGRSVDEMLREHPEVFSAPGDRARWEHDLVSVFTTGERRDGEWELPVDGTSHWLQSRAVPEYDERGEVEHVLVVATDITALKRSEAELEHQALHDPLTGLANRALLHEHLERAMARRAGQSVPAVLFIDLDRFKLVNDSVGHRAGDDLLVAVAERLAAIVRPADLIARLGGDEFVVVLDAVPDTSEPLRVAERIRRQLAVPLDIGGNEIVTTCSIGIAMPVSDGADADGLLRDADAAMYLAKSNGRDRYEIFDTLLRNQATEKLQMESALRRALEVGGLEVHYQPELDLGTGEVVGFEALVRWNHPTEGRLAAWAFIELAEETGIIVELGDWVLHQACLQAGEWKRARPDRPLTLRVNLSGRQFAQPDLVERVVGAMAEAQIEPSALCLEITETALMADPAAGLRVLNELRALGIELAIDDFGTGYSSLAHLKRLPVDVLKIDRSFVDGLGEDPDDTAIATAIISLARSMGMRVVAEGVETRRQLDELRRLGCDHAQGYLFARPAPADDAWGMHDPYPV